MNNCRFAVIRYKNLGNTAKVLVHMDMCINPSRVRAPKDKPNAEGTVGNISTWITAALRNEQFELVSDCAI